MNIQVNGDTRTVEKEASVADLLGDLEIRNGQVAVEVNLHVVDRQDFVHHILRDGDCVEIMSFIGGGADSSMAGCV